MSVTRKFLTSSLLAGAAVAAVLAAPTASADALSCTDIGSATQCVSPGNSQLTATPPVVAQPPTYFVIEHFGGHRR